MSKTFFVSCPKCGFRYPVGEALVRIKNFPTICPKCYHLYPPEESARGIEK